MNPTAQRPDAEYVQQTASLALRPFVQRFIHGYTLTPGPHRITIPPSDGLFLSYVRGSSMRVHFSDSILNCRTRLFVGGALRRESPMLESLDRFDLVGIQFTPCGFHRLFHEDASRFTDRMTEFVEVVGEAATRLEQSLVSLGDPPSEFEVVERFLLERVPAALPARIMEAAVSMIEAKQGQVRVEEVARHCGVSTRQLHRLFLKVVGVGAKHFAKTLQLRSVFISLTRQDETSLMMLAQDCGYFDQAHFIHDFNRFVGTNPAHFLQDEEPFLRTFLSKATTP